MIEVTALVVLAMLGVAMFAAVLVLLKVLLWTVLLPLRLLLHVLLLPLLLLKALIGGLVLLVVGPVVFIAAVAGTLALAAALITPLLPLLFVAFVIWFLVRAGSKPAALTRP